MLIWEKRVSSLHDSSLPCCHSVFIISLRFSLLLPSFYMPTDTLRAMINNLFKEKLYGKKK